MNIRQLGPDDRVAFRALRRQALITDPASFLLTLAEEDAMPRLFVEDLLDKPAAGSFFLGAEQDGQLVAMLGVRTLALVKIRHLTDILSVYVAPESRGQGLARQIIGVAIKRIFAQPQIAAITLHVVADMPAEQLYRALGFVEIGRHVDGHRLDGKSYTLLEMRLARP